ncbi:hypothetical protein C8J56DRAFT_770969, partial [Mycena floridula]
ILVGYLKLRQRQALEGIANSTKVVVPDGRWNCQDWIKEVLWGMITTRHMSQAQYQEIMNAAQRYFFHKD